ncbi:MAG: ZIP family metal transporter [Chloroflexi bacterium]|nr:ZIP family metal transporter [Chloroflexota bacterium]
MESLAQGVVASLVAGLATGLGGLPALLGRSVSHRAFDAVLGFAAGVMLALSGGALLVEVDLATPEALLALAAGGAAVLLLRAAGTAGGPGAPERVAREARVAVVVTLHNVVEGAAVVATFGAFGSSMGAAVALAIAVHNVPEGLAVAVPLLRAGRAPRQAALLALASGMGEPLGALAGAVALVAMGAVVPVGAAAAAAAGAMIVLAAIELIPEAFSHGFVPEASTGMLVGVIVALGLVALAA